MQTELETHQDGKATQTQPHTCTYAHTYTQATVQNINYNLHISNSASIYDFSEEEIPKIKPLRKILNIILSLMSSATRTAFTI